MFATSRSSRDASRLTRSAGRAHLDLGASDGDAHVLYDVGVGAAHMAGFADAAFVGATAAALLTSATPWRWLGV